MLKLTRWCIAHRRLVVAAWVVVAIGTTPSRGASAAKYATNFTLPGTQTQRVVDLLNKDFPTQSGDVDTIVFHVANGTSTRRMCGPRSTPLLARRSRCPPRRQRHQPVRERGAVQVSADRRTAFATVNYSKRAQPAPEAPATPCSTRSTPSTCPD